MNRYVLRLCNAGLIAFAVHLASPVMADVAPEKPATLPRPGVCARYHVVLVAFDGVEKTYHETIEWQNREMSADGKPLRWIEIRSEFDNPELNSTSCGCWFRKMLC